jgi:hypothetical protein
LSFCSHLCPSLPAPSNKQENPRAQLPKTSNNETPRLGHPCPSLSTPNCKRKTTKLDVASFPTPARASLMIPYRPLSSNKQAPFQKPRFDFASNRDARDFPIASFPKHRTSKRFGEIPLPVPVASRTANALFCPKPMAMLPHGFSGLRGGEVV